MVLFFFLLGACIGYVNDETFVAAVRGGLWGLVGSLAFILILGLIVAFSKE